MSQVILNPDDPLPDLSGEITLVLDLETSGLSRHHGAKICGVAIGDYDGTDFYLPVGHTDGNMSLALVIPWLKNLFDDPNKVWVMHNGKFDLAMLRSWGLELKGRLIDTMLLDYSHESSRFSYALDTLTRLHLPDFEHVQYEKLCEHVLATQRINLKSKGIGNKVNFALVPPSVLGPYALEDLDATRQVAQVLRNKKFGKRRENYGCESWDAVDLAKLEMELAPVLMDMEDTGVLIDVKRAVRLRDEAFERYEEQIRVMCQCSGGAVDPLSWKSHWDGFLRAGGEIKFWNAKKEARGKQKMQQFTTDQANSTGRPNWNAAALLSYLQQYRDTNANVYRYLLAYREAMLLNRINSTYIESYLEKIDTNNVLHGQFDQTGTVTGRLSSREPNLQNLARPSGTADQKAFEKFVAEKDEDALNRQVRGLFIARPGCALVSNDYSQIEYRTAVWYAQDQDMIARWRADPTVDYHLATQELLGLDRDISKTVNFGTLYGMGANGLAANLTAAGKPTTKAEAQEILNLLFLKRPSLRRLIDSIGGLAQRTGWVCNIYGRYCTVPRETPHKALNYLVQGTCGDMMRAALVRVHALIRKNGWPVKLLLTVHDEILSEMPIELVAEIGPQIAACMCDIPLIGMPLLSSVKVGLNWAEMVSLEEWQTKGVAA